MSSECSRGLCRKQQKDKKTASVLICTQCYTRHSHLSSDTLATHTHCQQWAQLGLVCLCVSKHPVNPGQGHCGITEPICGTESGDICPFDTHKWCVCVCALVCCSQLCSLTAFTPISTITQKYYDVAHIPSECYMPTTISRFMG